MTNFDPKSLSDHVLKFWPIFATVITLMMVLAGHSISLAMDVNTATDDVEDLKGSVKKIQDIQVDINKLNISNATLKQDVENVKEKINATNNKIDETNLLLRNLILEAKEKKASQPAPAPVQQVAPQVMPQQTQQPQVIYVVPESQYQQRQMPQQQYRIPTPFDGGQYAPQPQKYNNYNTRDQYRW